ncbi:hypothetical protein Tco_1024179, partial [Tanacetum coccineum]
VSFKFLESLRKLILQLVIEVRVKKLCGSMEEGLAPKDNGGLGLYTGANGKIDERIRVKEANSCWINNIKRLGGLSEKGKLRIESLERMLSKTATITVGQKLAHPSLTIRFSPDSWAWTLKQFGVIPWLRQETCDSDYFRKREKKELVTHDLEGYEFEVWDRSLSEIQLDHEKDDEFVVVVVKTIRGSGGESFWKEGDDFEVDVLRFHTCLTDILGFLEKLEWWFEQDIDNEGEEDEEGDSGSEV